MGTEFTSVATNILVEKLKIPFIVNIGVTGSFSEELKVGSVLVPTQITHYTANWKAKDSENSEDCEYILGTRAFATNRVVLSQFANYLTTSQYQKWKSYCKREVTISTQTEKKLNIAHPEVHLGHLASGNMVVDSDHYKKLLKHTDRKLMACDMEAAGFAIAEQFLRAPVRMAGQFVSLRCISDMAANKEEAESGEHFIIVRGADGQDKQIESREYAMRNVTILFMHLVKDRVINASTSAQLQQLEALMKSLKERSKVTEARSRLPQTQPTDQLISKIKTQIHFKTLSAENKRRVISHYKGDPNTDDLDKVGIELLQANNILKSKSASAKRPPKSVSHDRQHVGSKFSGSDDDQTKCDDLDLPDDDIQEKEASAKRPSTAPVTFPSKKARISSCDDQTKCDGAGYCGVSIFTKKAEKLLDLVKCDKLLPANEIKAFEVALDNLIEQLQ